MVLQSYIVTQKQKEVIVGLNDHLGNLHTFRQFNFFWRSSKIESLILVYRYRFTKTVYLLEYINNGIRWMLLINCIYLCIACGCSEG